jgi:predicted MFS family arabinose efflux permease
VLAYPIVAPHWRWLFLVGGVGLVAAPVIWMKLPEGRIWQRARVSGSALRLLLASPWRRRLIVIAATTALLAVLLEPAGLLFTLFASQTLRMSPTSISVLIAVSGLAGAASYVVGGFLSDRFGRRGPGAALTGATAMAAGLSFASGTPGFVVGNVLWSSFASAATPVFGAWTAELFPTRARATAEGMGSLASAVGSVVGLQAVGVLSQSIGLGRALALCGAVAFAGAALLLFLPETLGAPLPD